MGLFSSKKKKQVIGYKYYLGMHLICGHAHMDGLERIRVGEKIAWTQSAVLKDSNTTVNTSLTVAATAWRAMTFTTSSRYTCSSVAVPIFKNLPAGTYDPGTITCSIRATSGGLPTGTDLCKGTVEGDNIYQLVSSLNDVPYQEIKFDAPIILEDATQYAICMRCEQTGNNDSFGWVCGPAGGNYAGGRDSQSLFSGDSGWAFPVTEYDLLFKTYKMDGDAPNSTITIDNANLFGGDRKDGGVSGDVDIMFGESDQTQNSYLTARLDTDIPAYRGLFGLVLNQVYVGTSGYLKPWMLMCKRVTKQQDGTDQWYKEKAVIRPRTAAGDDMNAAHILRECLVAPEWGLGWSTDDIDDAAWKEAANILYDEGFGLSMLWDQVEPMEDFVDEILNYIAGILYQDLSSGKWVLSLTRDKDYTTPYDYYDASDDTLSAQMTYPAGNRQYAQVFKTSRNYKPASAQLKLYTNFAGTTTDIKVEIQGVDANSQPNGNVICEGIIANELITESADPNDATFVECIFDRTGQLTANTQYALVMYGIAGSGTIYWKVSANGNYLGGKYNTSTDDGVTWTTVEGNDFMFKIFAGGELETFTESEIIAIEDFSRPTMGEIINSVTVKFWDKLNHKTRSVTDDDGALIEKEDNNVIEKILNYQGICDADLANDVAARELRLQTSMLAGIRLRCTRKMAHLKPNDIFLFSWPDLDITQMAVRVLDADYGTLQDPNVILTCAEDEFQSAPTIYGTPPDTLNPAIVSDAVDVTDRMIIEIPYWSLVNDILRSKDLVDALDPDFTRMAIVAGKPVDDAFDYDLYTRFSPSYEFIDVGQGNTLFCPHGTLSEIIPQAAADIDVTLATSTDLDDVTVGSFAIINNEFFLVNSVTVTTGVVNLSRGILDSVPALHNVGDIIYFAGMHYTDVEEEYTSGDTPGVKLLTRTGNGILDIGDATEEIATAFDSRQTRPYPPGNLKFNGESFPTFFSSGAHGNKIQLTWSHRDRTHATQLNSMVLHTDSSNFGPEAGVTYTIKVYGQDGVSLGRTVTGLSGTSYDYTESFEVNDFGALQGSLRFRVYAVRGGYNSWNDGYDVTVIRSLRGTVSASSSVTGFLVSSLYGSIEANSTSSGSISIEKGLAGSIDETSIVSNSDLDRTPSLVGSTNATSDVSGSVYFNPVLIGVVSAVSNITGALTVTSVLKDNYPGTAIPYSALNLDNANDWAGQSFTTSESYSITRAEIWCKKGTGDNIGTINVELYAVDGSGHPTGSILASGTIQDGDVSDSAYGWVSCVFGSPYSLSIGTKYCLVVHGASLSAANILTWSYDDDGAGGSDFSGGDQEWSTNGGSSWATDTTQDQLFRCYGS